MARLRWIQALQSLGLEFWLLLPLLGLGFWVTSGGLTDRMLSRSSETTLYIESVRHPNRQALSTVQAIIVVIHPRQGASTVMVKTANSALKTLLFEFPTIDPERIEAAISHELGLPHDRIHALMQYQTEPGNKQ
ncbi:MAG: hypothetical protein ACAF41_23990 [Leptolyngbya sp. BL-A-14]